MRLARGPPSRRAAHPARSRRRARSTATPPHRPDSPAIPLNEAPGSPPPSLTRHPPCPIPRHPSVPDPAAVLSPRATSASRTARGPLAAAPSRPSSAPACEQALEPRCASGARPGRRNGAGMPERGPWPSPPTAPLAAVLSGTVTAGTRTRSPPRVSRGPAHRRPEHACDAARARQGAIPRGGVGGSSWATDRTGSSRRTADRAPSRSLRRSRACAALARPRFTWNGLRTASAAMPGAGSRAPRLHRPPYTQPRVPIKRCSDGSTENDGRRLAATFAVFLATIPAKDGHTVRVSPARARRPRPRAPAAQDHAHVAASRTSSPGRTTSPSTTSEPEDRSGREVAPPAHDRRPVAQGRVGSAGIRRRPHAVGPSPPDHRPRPRGPHLLARTRVATPARAYTVAAARRSGRAAARSSGSHVSTARGSPPRGSEPVRRGRPASPPTEMHGRCARRSNLTAGGDESGADPGGTRP
jgi:hypothetical protein